MKYKEYKLSPDFNVDSDTYCMHCLGRFVDEDELGRCEQTQHLTHTTCTKHNA
jgi:hypothetical protein